jgi:hypothetical protein
MTGASGRVKALRRTATMVLVALLLGLATCTAVATLPLRWTWAVTDWGPADGVMRYWVDPSNAVAIVNVAQSPFRSTASLSWILLRFEGGRVRAWTRSFRMQPPFEEWEPWPDAWWAADGFPDPPPDTAIRVLDRTGFPFRSHWLAQDTLSPGNPAQRFVEHHTLRVGTVRVPMGILPIGFAANLVIYAGVWWVFMLAPGRVRQVIRRRRGLCTACGYSTSGLAPGQRCPECGAAAASPRVGGP